MSLDQGIRYNSGFNYHNQYLPQDHYGGQLSSFQNELNGLNLNRLLNEVREAPQQNQNFHSTDQFSSNFGTSDHFGSKFSNDLFGSKFSSSSGTNPLQSLLEKNYSNHGNPESSFSNNYSSWSTAGSFPSQPTGTFPAQPSGNFSTQSHGNFPSQVLTQTSSSFAASPFSDPRPVESSLFASPGNLPTLTSRLDYTSQYSNFSSGSLLSSQPSSKASSSNLLGLSDISTRLEGLSQGSMLMSQGSLSPKAKGSRGSTPLSWNPMMNLPSKTPSLTPSPILSLGNPSAQLATASNPSIPRNLSSKLASISSPEDDFVFFSDDEDEKSGKPKSPKKHQQAASMHEKMQTSIRGIAKLKVSKSTANCSAQSVPSSPQPTSWSQIVRTSSTKLPSLSVSPSSGPVTRSSITPSPPPKPEAQLVTEELPPSTTTLDYHRGPKVDPRWPVAQQVFLGPIPMSISWDEIRNVFYTKVQRRELLHFYVQSKPVNEVVYGQVVFDKVALANRVLKEGPVKVRGHLINVTSMKEKLKNDKKKM